MLIETYEITEVSENSCAPMDAEEARKLSAELGLESQSRFYSVEPNALVFPFRKLTAQEAWVYGLVLPQRTKAESYADSAIPVRVLRAGAMAKGSWSGEKAGCLVIWHTGNGDKKDPLLLWMVGTDWSHELYLIARWGEVLEPFSVLIEQAKSIWLATSMADLQKAKMDIEGCIASLPHMVEKCAMTGQAKSFYFSC